MEDNKLAKISLGINALLIIAVIVLFVKMPSGSAGNTDEIDSTLVEFVDDGQLTIAYYRSDTLSAKSDFVKEVQNQIEQVQVDAQNDMAAKEKEIQRWQKSWEDKGQLLPREQEVYMAEAQQKQMEIAQFEQDLNMKVGMEQENLMLALYQRLEKYAKSFCEKNEIDMLVSLQMGQNVIYMNPTLDVTKQFLNHVNKEYNSTFEGEMPEAGEEE